jgi:prefoldin subunit 5
MNYMKVKDNDYLIRDVNSNSIVNIDVDSYNAYIENYKNRYDETQKIREMENEMKDIKNNLTEIKNLLRSLTNGSK